MLDEARAEGMPISALYPSTLTVYRKAGYEIAGVRHIYRQEFDFAPPRPDAPVKIRAAGPADAAAIRSFYAERARGADGNLDRSDLLWDRLLLGRGAEPPLAFLACDANGLAGYAVYPQPEEWGKPVAVQDIWLASRDAARAFMGFFVNLRSTVSGFAWRGGPEDPLAHWLPELNERGIRREIWMTRIVDAAAALEARGWPEDARGELGLEIEDGWFPWNRGRFTLEVADGQARVRPGGSGEARLDIRRLAQLYTGHLSPQSLAAMGELQIGRPALAFASRVFAGRKPWMMDGF